ncbi:hypothetical protein EZY14_007940 [Kordia sp. TARA_039_SRF]|nr:hypothetical protein EZY14_007940 [Kordia sp. TARA_039_SRF]
MAILAKIRQRTLVLILIIGLALFAFVISDVFNTNGGGEKQPTEIGSINGEDISYNGFKNQVEYLKNLYQGRQSTMQIVNSLWNQKVSDALITQELDKLGITIEKDELWSLLVASPNITNSERFQDESGVFVEAKLKEYIDNLEATKNLSPQSMAEYNNWVETERNTIINAKRELYNNLVKAGSIVTVTEGELAYRAENDKVTFKYVRVPYTSIADSLVEVRESDVKNYISKHKSEFQVEASRDIQYVFFPEKPSKADEDAAKQEVEEMKAGFAAAEDASAYANINTGTNESENFMYKNQLPKEHANAIMAMEEGDVYGPYKIGNKFKISRLLEKRQLPDSVKTRHILIRFAGSTGADAELKKTKEDAKKQADSLLAVIKRNKSKFANRVKELATSIPGLAGTQREVARWAFRDDTKVGDINRLNVQGGVIVAQLTAKNTAGLSSIAEASTRVLPIIRSQKKAEMIKEKYASANTLSDLASASGNAEQQATALSMQAPTVPGAGEEPKVVGTAFALNEGDASRLVEGKTGVYMIQVVSKTKAPEKDTYLVERNDLRTKRVSKALSSVSDALKSSAEIEDRRASFY